MSEETEVKEQENEDLLKEDGKDLQRIKSWVGRIESSNKETQTQLSSLAQKIESLNQKPSFGEDDNAKFNEKLHNMILEGKVMEALNLVNNVNRTAEQQIRASEKKRFDAVVESLSDDPIMKNPDLSKRVKDAAQSLMSQGYDAKVAVNQAKLAVENETLRDMASKGKVNLDMLGAGGGKPPAQKSAELPPEAEKAYQSGKSKGIFTDRQDYIDNLDPRVREAWGLS